MEKNKRRFNLIDAAIIALALLALAAIWLLRDRSTGASAAVYPMELTIELNSVPAGTLELMQPGTEIYRSTDNTYLGAILSAEAEVYSIEEYSAALGRVVRYVPVEDEYHVILTLSGTGYQTEKSIVFGGATSRIGDTIYVKGLGFAAAGYIIGIDPLDAPDVPVGSSGAGKLRFTYTAAVQGVRSATTDAIRVGDTLYDKATDSVIGTVLSIETIPFEVTRLNAAGEPITVTYDTRSTLILTIEALGSQKESGYWLGTSELKIGTAQTFYNRTCASSFTVLSILSVEDAD